MAKLGKTLEDLAREITKRQDSARDLIVPAAKMRMEPRDGAPALIIDSAPAAAVGLNVLPANRVAHDQIAEYAGVPLAYYKRMEAEAPELLCNNVNTWLTKKNGDQRMVRTLFGGARAFLSNRYRALDNHDLAEAVLPVLLEQQLMILSCEITDTRMYIKAVDPTIQKDVPAGKRMGDGEHNIFDTLCPAITISNSEVGMGSLSIESGVYTRACTNLALFGAKMRKTHTGHKADISEEAYALLTDKTKRLTDAALFSQARDLVKACFERAQFEALAQRVSDSANDTFEAIETPEVVVLAGKKFGLGETEQKGILGELIKSGNLSRYGLHAAVTRYSSDVESYDRATELERLGGRIIDLSRNEWSSITRGAKALADAA